MSQFELETAVTQLEENLWRGELHKGWRIGAGTAGSFAA